MKRNLNHKNIFAAIEALYIALVCFFVFIFLLPGKGNADGHFESLLTHPAFAQDNRIVIEGADSISEISTQPPDGLISVASADSPRVLAEYADSILTQDLQKPEQLSQQAASVSPRILVEYADSILNINLERPIDILPNPSQPPATTTPPAPTSGTTPAQTPAPTLTSGPIPPQTPTSAPTPPATTQPKLEPGQPIVNLYGQQRNVFVGEEIILYLSVVNPITSPGVLVVQLTLSIPSGWSVTSSGFGHVVGGLSTNTYEIEQGPNPQAIDVHILANEPYNGNVTGDMDYYFKGEESKYHAEANLPVTASLAGASTKSLSQPPSTTSTEGKGINWTIVSIIIGICTGGCLLE